MVLSDKLERSVIQTAVNQRILRSYKYQQRFPVPLTNPFGHFKTVHGRHTDIQKNHIIRVFFMEVQQLLTGYKNINLIFEIQLLKLSGQRFIDRLQKYSFVVTDCYSNHSIFSFFLHYITFFMHSQEAQEFFVPKSQTFVPNFPKNLDFPFPIIYNADNNETFCIIFI